MIQKRHPLAINWFFFLLLISSPAFSQQESHLEIDSPFGSFVEDDFPFFMQTLDAREFGEDPEPSNLTPRGIIVNLGADHYGCFDPDLLRWSLIWKANEKGEFLTMDGMAPGSYRLPNRKAPAGQESLPRPIGTPLFATPALPGWLSTEDMDRESDPRERGISDEGEVGIGPIPSSHGRFEGIDLSNGTLVLAYRVGEYPVLERPFMKKRHGKWVLHRAIEIKSREGTIISDLPGLKKLSWMTRGMSGVDSPGNEVLLLKPHDQNPDSSKRWAKKVTISTEGSTSSSDPLVYDDLPLPVPNPWERNVRLSGFDFFSDGRAAFCTFDGDVWIAEGLAEGSEEITWSRFAAGLHEPKTICIVDDEIYVSDRNGIARLQDSDGNGEADWYENFSNIVPQTAETREFAMDMVAAKDGGFYLAKGGQIGSTKGIANGTIVKVSADGLSYEIIATGLRQPYIGYDSESGILTSSDQQGHWKPATPIYRIDEGKYYGFQPAKLKEKAVHPAPIAPPEIWIPHFINPSGASQVWLRDAKMGFLDNSLIHIGYNRPEIFKVFLSEDRTQAAVSPLLSGFPAGILKGRVHPVDGRLYVCGFEIWGTSGEQISGLFRIRPGEGVSRTPVEVRASQRGVLLRFEEPLSPDLVTELGRYSVDRWNYEQTHNYGSGNFQLDGSPGQESVPVASAQLSADRKSLFLGIVGMKPSHSLRVTYRLPHPEATEIESVYLTLHSLSEMDLTKQGFKGNDVDLTPPAEIAGAGSTIEPTAKLGKEVATRYGCIACHATGEKSTMASAADLGSSVAVGPAWTGLWKSRREFTDGSFIKNADETYLRESILDPARRVTEGYVAEKTGVGMPSYLGVLKNHEIDSIILYIKALK
ncbi:MAG: DUF6797 domain-containing protein [Verrucomicrobiota bacterium]